MINTVLCLKSSDLVTRGNRYIYTEHEDAHYIRIIDDYGKKRKLSKDIFDFENSDISHIVRWKYDDDPNQYEIFNSWIEITMYMSDGSRRWSKLITPEILSKMLSKDNIDPPGLGGDGFILIRSTDKEDIQKMLTYLEENNLLESYSIKYK